MRMQSIENTYYYIRLKPALHYEIASFAERNILYFYHFLTNFHNLKMKIGVLKTAFLALLSPPGGVRGGLVVRVSCGHPVGLYEPLLLNKVASKVTSCVSRRMLLKGSVR